MAAGIESIIPYSSDYKRELFGQGAAYFTIPIDFDFAMSLPDMENRVYYKKCDADRTKERLNQLGICLLVQYWMQTKKIESITVKFNAGCMVEYKGQQDIDGIIEMVIREKGNEQ